MDFLPLPSEASNALYEAHDDLLTRGYLATWLRDLAHDFYGVTDEHRLRWDMRTSRPEGLPIVATLRFDPEAREFMIIKWRNYETGVSFPPNEE